MALGYVTLVTALAVLAGATMTWLLCLDSNRVRWTIRERRRLARDVAPYLGVVAVVFVATRLTHEPGLQLSYALDWDITADLYAIEGEFVARLQDVTPDALIGPFAVLYMIGFPYLLATAPVLYAASPSRRHLKELVIAYALNYTVGSICYALIIAYGPRNYLESVDGLLYQEYPQSQTLTAAVSANTNVFPSLHTSLAVVVLAFAWRTRDTYPRWFQIASLVASGVVLSTMTLGIHWLLDVVAGVALAVWSVLAASRLVGWAEGDVTSGPTPTADEGDDGARSDFGD